MPTLKATDGAVPPPVDAIHRIDLTPGSILQMSDEQLAELMAKIRRDRSSGPSRDSRPPRQPRGPKTDGLIVDDLEDSE